VTWLLITRDICETIERVSCCQMSSNNIISVE